MSKKCLYDTFCSNPKCGKEHSYEFPLGTYTPPTDIPEETIRLPCQNQSWPYIQRAFNNIQTYEDLGFYLHALLRTQQTSIKNILTEQENSDFITLVLPMIKQMANNHYEILHTNIPLLFETGVVQLTRKQCCCLLSCFALGLYSLPSMQSGVCNDVSSFPMCFFSTHYGPCVAEIHCFINYFVNVAKNQTNEEFMNEKVTYRRHSMLLTKDDLLRCEKPLLMATIDDERGIMEINDTPNLKADFANQFIGGGVLQGGCVQEEIMFMECPEAICSMLFCCVTADDETIRIENIVRYSQINGYARSIKFGRDLGITQRHSIVAFDAIVCRYYELQYQEKLCMRDMTKLYSAVSQFEEGEEMIPFITGKWGCGAFGGEWTWKYLQQLLVCSYVGRPFVFTTFHTRKDFNLLMEFQQRIQQDPPTVGNAFKWILSMISESRYDELLTSPNFPSFSHPF